MEQQYPAGLAEGQVPEFVQNDQVKTQQTRRDPSGMVLRFFLLQCVGQIYRRVEADSSDGKLFVSAAERSLCLIKHFVVV